MSRGRKAGRGILSTERKTRDGVAGRRTQRRKWKKRNPVFRCICPFMPPSAVFCVLLVRMILLHVFTAIAISKVLSSVFLSSYSHLNCLYVTHCRKCEQCSGVSMNGLAGDACTHIFTV